MIRLHLSLVTTSLSYPHRAALPSDSARFTLATIATVWSCDLSKLGWTTRPSIVSDLGWIMTHCLDHWWTIGRLGRKEFWSLGRNVCGEIIHMRLSTCSEHVKWHNLSTPPTRLSRGLLRFAALEYIYFTSEVRITEISGVCLGKKREKLRIIGYALTNDSEKEAFQGMLIS